MMILLSSVSDASCFYVDPNENAVLQAPSFGLHVNTICVEATIFLFRAGKSKIRLPVAPSGSSSARTDILSSSSLDIMVRFFCFVSVQLVYNSYASFSFVSSFSSMISRWTNL